MPDVESEWADPWEHARLLGDRSRNRALVQLLERQAAGATVIEVGCGTGVWSIVAARLGAKRVIALEPSDLWTCARDLVVENGLEEVVTVLPVAIEQLTPDRLPENWRGADLIFSELLNADPLAEGIVTASAAARRLLAPGGVLAPHQLDLYAALAHTEAHTDLSSALAQLDGLTARFGIDLSVAADVLAEADIEAFVSPSATLDSAPQQVLQISLDRASAIPERLQLQFQADRPATGAALWWVAHYGPELRMSNAPGTPNHWGQLVCAWPRPLPRGVVRVDLLLEDDTVRLEPADNDHG